MENMRERLDYSQIRHTLHQLAEPSGAEVLTHNFLLTVLNSLSPSEIISFQDSYSLLVCFDSGRDGTTVLLRGDFDAVCVPETLQIPYASQNAGVAHKCGHDGHTAILLGVAEQLHLHPLLTGRVLLFFQAAEETGEGAQKLIASNVLDKFHPDHVFALHNIPGEPIGTVLCRPNSFTCAVVSCDVELHGRTAHAAEPWKAVSPYPAAKAITDELLAMNQYDIRRSDFRLLTLVEFRIGDPAYGVAAGHGILRFTLRTKQDQYLHQTKESLANAVERVTNQFNHITYHIKWKEYFAASHNHRESVEILQHAAKKCSLPFVETKQPFSWGEDFGLLTQLYDGALFGLGSGVNQPSLHHQHFDFPDELIPIGVRLFTDILNIIYNRKISYS